MEAGRDVEVSQPNSDEDCSGDSSELGDEDIACRGSRVRKRPGGVWPIEQAGEVPHDAVITAEQAESALGRNQATEWDEDLLEQIDLDQRAEEEELPGRVVHPISADYSLLSWCPEPGDPNHSPDVVSTREGRELASAFATAQAGS